MGTENRGGNDTRYARGQAAAGTGNDWLAGLMFCYNMPVSANMPGSANMLEPASEECPEAEAWAADQAAARDLMRYYNE